MRTVDNTDKLNSVLKDDEFPDYYVCRPPPPSTIPVTSRMHTGSHSYAVISALPPPSQCRLYLLDGTPITGATGATRATGAGSLAATSAVYWDSSLGAYPVRVRPATGLFSATLVG